MKSFRFTLAVLAVLAVALPALAQHPDPLKTNAFSFGFNGLYLSGPYEGNVGGKFWLEGNRAVTLGVSGASSGSSTKTPDTLGYDQSQRYSNVGLNAALQQHFELTPGLSPYLMVGVSTGMSRSRERSQSSFDTRWTRNRSYNLGLQAGLGLEYWFARRLSLSGQQTFGGNFSFGRREENYPLEREYTTQSSSFGLGTSAMTLNVYL